MLILIRAAAVTSCSPDAQPIESRFAAFGGDQRLDCNATDSALAMTDLRFYVHAPALVPTDGCEGVPIALVEHGRWQGRQLTLIDLEDGRGSAYSACRDEARPHRDRAARRGACRLAAGRWAGDGRLSPYKSEFVRGFEISDSERAHLLAFLDALTDPRVLTDAQWSNPFRSRGK